MGILLREGRKEDLKKKYSTKFNEEDLDFILNISDKVKQKKFTKKVTLLLFNRKPNKLLVNTVQIQSGVLHQKVRDILIDIPQDAKDYIS